MTVKIVVTLLLFLVLNRSLCWLPDDLDIGNDNNPNLIDFTPEDNILVQLTPIGLSPYPDDPDDYVTTCDDYVKMTKTPKSYAKLVTPILKLPEFYSLFFHYVTQRVTNSKSICETARNFPNAYKEFAEKFNKQLDKLKPIRDNFSNAMSAAIDPKTTISSNTVACLIQKWSSETLAAITDPYVKDFLEKPLINLVELTKKLKASPNCSLKGYKPLVVSKYRSIELLFYEGVRNTLNKEKAKAEEECLLEESKRIVKEKKEKSRDRDAFNHVPSIIDKAKIQKSKKAISSEEIKTIPKRKSLAKQTKTQITRQKPAEVQTLTSTTTGRVTSDLTTLTPAEVEETTSPSTMSVTTQSTTQTPAEVQTSITTESVTTDSTTLTSLEVEESNSSFEESITTHQTSTNTEVESSTSLSTNSVSTQTPLEVQTVSSTESVATDSTTPTNSVDESVTTKSRWSLW